MNFSFSNIERNETYRKKRSNTHVDDLIKFQNEEY